MDWGVPNMLVISKSAEPKCQGLLGFKFNQRGVNFWNKLLSNREIRHHQGLSVGIGRSHFDEIWKGDRGLFFDD